MKLVILYVILAMLAAKLASSHKLPYPPSSWKQELEEGRGGEGGRGGGDELSSLVITGQHHSSEQATEHEEDDKEEEEDDDAGRRVYLMYMAQDDGNGNTDVEESMIAGEYFEGPAETFLQLQEEESTPLDDQEDDEIEKVHSQRQALHRGRRDAVTVKEQSLQELERYLQQDKKEEKDEGAGEGEGEGEGEGGEEIVMAQWSNKLLNRLSVTCPAGFGLYRMRSIFYSSVKDRLFLFTCKRVAPLCMKLKNYNPSRRSCKWVKGNNAGVSGTFQCPTNYYLSGMWSRFNCMRDREWWGLCCNTPRLCTTGCQWSNYLNSYHSSISYSTGGVMSGMISTFSKTYLDRRFRALSCNLKAC